MCRPCLQQWATVTNLCPLCKKRFTSIYTGKVSIAVPDRKQTTPVDEDDDFAAIEALLAQEEEEEERLHADDFIAPEGQICLEQRRRRSRLRLASESEDLLDFIAPEGQIEHERRHGRRRPRLRLASGADLNTGTLPVVQGRVSRSRSEIFRRRILSDDDEDDYHESAADDRSENRIVPSPPQKTSLSPMPADDWKDKRPRTEIHNYLSKDRIGSDYQIQGSPVFNWPRPFGIRSCLSNSRPGGLGIRTDQSPFFSFRRKPLTPPKPIPKISIVQKFEEFVQEYGPA